MGDTLHAFKLEAHYETSASLLQFIDGQGLQQILHRCGIEHVRLVAEGGATALATEEVADSEPEHEQYYHASSRMQVQSFRPAGAHVDSNASESDPTVDDPMTLDESSSVLEITNHDHDRDTSNKEIVESDTGSAEPDGLEKCCLRPMPDVDDADLSKGIKSVIKFKCYTLQPYDMTRQNHTEFYLLREFFSTSSNPGRGNNRSRNALTISKSRERICGYLGWLKESGRKKAPSFVDFEDVDVFLVLEAVRCQRLIVERLWNEDDEDPGRMRPKLAKEMQKYLALAFYSAIPPSRSKEIRLIVDRVLPESESKKSLQNHVAMIHDRHLLVQYKNNYSNGRDSIELPSEANIIIKYLHFMMRPETRTQVARGKQHGFFFCKLNGDPFENAGEWSMFLSSIINKHIGVPNISTNALRHAFTT
ncbi:hypothetical protein HK104_003298 [Borealophlyctis nickersoniae]|nr:hypothetical protein HK104_003298 [Borealophlyctis nickersoniae]